MYESQLQLTAVEISLCDNTGGFWGRTQRRTMLPNSLERQTGLWLKLGVSCTFYFLHPNTSTSVSPQTPSCWLASEKLTDATSPPPSLVVLPLGSHMYFMVWPPVTLKSNSGSLLYNNNPTFVLFTLPKNSSWPFWKPFVWIWPLLRWHLLKMLSEEPWYEPNRPALPWKKMIDKQTHIRLLFWHRAPEVILRPIIHNYK